MEDIADIVADEEQDVKRKQVELQALRDDAQVGPCLQSVILNDPES